MTALTIRLPDEKFNRLKALAKQRRASVNHLIDKMARLMLAEFDAETRLMLRAERGRGKKERGLELLEKAANGRPSENKYEPGPFCSFPAPRP